MGYYPPKNTYDAKIGDKNLRVDIYDLPYDEFSAENPLIILGNVSLADQTKTTDLSNVHIIGSLDISKQKYSIILPKIVKGAFICRSNQQMRDVATKSKVDVFHADFVFPKGITEIDCSHSITNLSVLMGKIPETVTKIIVADAILTNISGDTDKFIEASLFRNMYPDIVVIGEKKGKLLSEILDVIPSANIQKESKTSEPQKTVKTTKQKPVETELLMKTDDFYDVRQLFDICVNDSVIKSLKILDSTLDREIRRAVEKIEHQTRKNPETGSAVTCIKTEDALKLVETLKINLQKKAAKKSGQSAQNSTLLDISTKTVTKKEKAFQTEEFCNKNDILGICLADERIKDLIGDDLELLKIKIRKFMNTFPDRKLLINPETNSIISCILRSNVSILIEKVCAELQEIARKKPQKKTAKGKTATSKKTQQQPVNTPKAPILMPVEIKKYIPQKIWKSICKACGKDNSMKKFVLDTIASVNLPVQRTLPSCHLKTIDPITHEITTSSYLRRKSSNCIIQSISDTLYKDNKRIVWSYLPQEKILVCTGFYLEHTKTKSGNDYQKTCEFASAGMDDRGTTITLQKINDEDYQNVNDLFEQLERDLQKELKKQIDIEKATEHELIIKKNTETRSGKRARIKTSKAEKVNYTPDQTHVVHTLVSQGSNEEQQNTPNKNIEEEKTTGSSKIITEEPKETKQMKKNTPLELIALSPELNPNKEVKTLTDIYAIETYIQSFIKLIDETVKEGLEFVATETDIDKQLKKMDDIREVLIQKAKIQSTLSEFSKTSLLLDTIKRTR